MAIKKIFLKDPENPKAPPREGIVHDDHPKPVSRRDFLKTGLWGTTATVFAPTPLAWLLSQEKALAASCATPSVDINRPHYLEVDFVGGQALWRVFLAGRYHSPTANYSDPLAAHMNALLPVSQYKYAGWNPTASNAVEIVCGFPMARDHIFTTLLKAHAGPAALAATQIISDVNLGLADASQNLPLSIGSAVAAMAGGALVSPMVSQSGAHKPTIDFKKMISPSLVEGQYSFERLYNPGLIPSSLAKKLYETKQSMSIGRRDFLQGLVGGSRIANQFECGSIKAQNVLGSGISLNPVTSADTLYKQTMSASNTGVEELAATIALGLNMNLAAAATVVIPQCDVHDRDPARGLETRGFAKAAAVIGTALRCSHAKGVPLMISLITDGTSYTNNAYDAYWEGDFNTNQQITFFMHPRRPVPVKQLQTGGGLIGSGLSSFDPDPRTPFHFDTRYWCKVQLHRYLQFWKGSTAGIEEYIQPDGENYRQYMVLA